LGIETERRPIVKNAVVHQPPHCVLVVRDCRGIEPCADGKAGLRLPKSLARAVAGQRLMEATARGGDSTTAFA
jgi:hypothetical protein